MPRSTRLPEGRALLLTLVGGVVLACLGTLTVLDGDATAGPDRQALIRRAALTGPAVLTSSRPAFAAVRDSTDDDSLDADTLGGDTLGLRGIDLLGFGLLGFDLPGTGTLDASTLGAHAGDSLLALADTTEVLPDTGRASRLLPPFRRDRYNAALLPRRRPPLTP